MPVNPDSIASCKTRAARRIAPFAAYEEERIIRFPGLSARRLHREIRDLVYAGSFVGRFETPPRRQAQVNFAASRRPPPMVHQGPRFPDRSLPMSGVPNCGIRATEKGELRRTMATGRGASWRADRRVFAKPATTEYLPRGPMFGCVSWERVTGFDGNEYRFGSGTGQRDVGRHGRHAEFPS